MEARIFTIRRYPNAADLLIKAPAFSRKRSRGNIAQKERTVLLYLILRKKTT
jgi:hypothetical protein